MAKLDFRNRKIQCQIVYVGPGLSGKTTNIQIIHKFIPSQKKGALQTIDTVGDRTIYFDFLPVGLGKVAGMTVTLSLYTVPGQVKYRQTRRVVLQGVDALVFVADSQKSKMEENLESLQDVTDLLGEMDLGLRSLPLVFQWNKRDLPDVLPVEELDRLIKKDLKAPSFEAIATDGIGVFPTLKQLIRRTFIALEAKYGKAQEK